MGAVVGIPAIGYVLAPALKDKLSRGVDPGRAIGMLPGRHAHTFQLYPLESQWLGKIHQQLRRLCIPQERERNAVFSNVCTHLSCRVIWNDSRKSICVPVPRR